MEKFLIAVVLSLSISACASIETSIKRIADNVIFWEKPYTEKDTQPCDELLCDLYGNPITGIAVLSEDGTFFETKYKDGKAVSGYVYDESGNKTKMNNAHLHKWNKRME